MQPAGVGVVGGRGATLAATAPSGGLGGRGGGAGGRQGCGLSAPSGFLGGGFFEGSGGSRGKVESGEEVGAEADAPLPAQPPTFQSRPLDPLTQDPAQSQPCLSSRQKPSLLQALQTSSSSAAQPWRTWPGLGTWPSPRIAVPAPGVQFPLKGVNSRPGRSSFSLVNHLTLRVFTHLLPHKIKV